MTNGQDWDHDGQRTSVGVEYLATGDETPILVIGSGDHLSNGKILHFHEFFSDF